uniref:Protein shisa-5-like n=1 Tax=Acanthochromis polyacanthus TaxID=80966 RepID=A0A3Q1EBL5_9TELE
MVRGSLLRRWFGSDQTSSCLASDEIPRFLTRYGNLEATMASGLPGVAVLALCVVLSPCVYGDRCSDNNWWLSEEEKEECKYKNFSHGPAPMVIGFVISVIVMLIFICCCVCPCCCLYKICRKPRPVIATTTHTTVVTGTPHPYPQQQAVMPVPSQSYQAVQYPAYQPVPVQPGYPAQPMPTSPYQGQQFTPPPTYQEATGPAHPPQPMPYSQAAYGPGQPAYPPQPPVQPQPNAPPAYPDFLAQPAYNPEYVAPPPKTG